MWYNSNNMSKNLRASKILGCHVGGDAILIVENHEITIDNLKFSEAALENTSHIAEKLAMLE